MQSNVSAQQLQNTSSLSQCLLEYVHFSFVLCSSRGVSWLMAVFEEGFTKHLQHYKHQEPSRYSVKRLLDNSAAAGKKVGAKVSLVWQTDLERHHQKHERYRNIKLNTELLGSASGENIETNTFFRGKKKKEKNKEIFFLKKREEKKKK